MEFKLVTKPNFIRRFLNKFIVGKAIQFKDCFVWYHHKGNSIYVLRVEPTQVLVRSLIESGIQGKLS